MAAMHVTVLEMDPKYKRLSVVRRVADGSVMEATPAKRGEGGRGLRGGEVVEVETGGGDTKSAVVHDALASL